MPYSTFTYIPSRNLPGLDKAASAKATSEAHPSLRNVHTTSIALKWRAAHYEIGLMIGQR